MRLIQSGPILLALLLLGLSRGDARADGGVIRLREAQGPFVITIFTPNDPIQDGLMDVSVMVQRRDSRDPILDGSVDLIFKAPVSSPAKPAEQLCGMAGAGRLVGTAEPSLTQFTIQASRKLAANKLLYAAPVRFGIAGNWQLEAIIKHRTEAAKVVCNIPVGSPARQFFSLVPYLVIPPLAAVLFVANQGLRKHPVLNPSSFKRRREE